MQLQSTLDRAVVSAQWVAGRPTIQMPQPKSLVLAPRQNTTVVQLQGTLDPSGVSAQRLTLGLYRWMPQP